jgi:uncharacterized membrane protein
MSEKTGVPEHVSDNIDAILALQARAEQALRPDQRAIEGLARVLGQPRSLYGLLCAVVAWGAYNSWATAKHAPVFDAPPFFYLQGFIALYAAVTTTIVLITQNRQQKDEQRNAHLELQVSLLAEQRTAKIVALLEELRRDMPNVRNRVDPLADALQEAVAPTAVSSALDEGLSKPPTTTPHPES